MRSKKGFEFSFSWIFAIIVGAMIISLAVFAAVRAVNVGKTATETSLAKQFTVILEPFETKLASSKNPAPLELNDEVIFFNKCINDSGFGSQKIKVSLKSGFYKGQEGEGYEVTALNKYIFSDANETGKKFYYFTKSFNMPFKVANLIFMTTKKYCFVGLEEGAIKDEVENVKREYLRYDSTGKCKDDEIKVSFPLYSGTDWDIKVDPNSDELSGIVTKKIKEGGVLKDVKLAYSDNLVFAAIFSSPSIYECNVNRLFNRMKEQTLIYIKESDYLNGNNKCNVLSESNLIDFYNSIGTYQNSDANNMNLVLQKALKLDDDNIYASCPLWPRWRNT